MNPKSWSHHLISALFASILAISSIGNLITGYELPVGAIWQVFLWCAFTAITIAVLFRIPHGGKIMVGLAALSIFLLGLAELFWPTLQTQIETLCFYLSSHYHDVYDWPILGAQSVDNVSVPLILWAIVVAFCANWYICRGKHITVAILPAILPLTLCLLTADKVPNAIYLFLLIFALATLLITDFTRRTQPEQHTRIVLWFTLPVALLLALVFLCNPKADYVNQAGKLQKDLSVWFDNTRNTAEAFLTGQSLENTGDKIRSLKTLGAKNQSTRSVMVVNSPITETLYLRERDYDIYTGTAWEASVGRPEKFTSGAASIGTLTILTYSTRGTLYVPYYAVAEIELTGGALENEKTLQQYTYPLSQTMSPGSSHPGLRYTVLFPETQAWAKNLVNQLTMGMETNREKVEKIESYVRNIAEYDISTPKMDSSHNDFSQWFLEESETGYCVHYATAAAVLLRAAEIPARYVEGYIVEAQAGTDVVVNKQQAHAWVEYYDWLARGWCILEATPIYETVEKPMSVSGAPQGGDTSTEEEEQKDHIETDKPGGETAETKLPSHITPTLSGPRPEMTKPTRPSQNNNTTPQEPVNEPWKMSNWMKAVLKCLILVFCVILQGTVRIYWKRKLWNHGAPNENALRRWRQTRTLANRLKQTYPEELETLALKARFSQHEIQPEELQQYEDYRLTLLALIKEKPWYQRLFFKWILAIA